MAKGHGGKRAGAGIPLGFKYPNTISKEQARDAVRTMVIAQLEPLIHAQLAHAKGLEYLVRRDKKTGKFVTVGPDDLADIDQDETPLEVWKKEPSVQAFTDLLNRALDKPKEQEIEIKVSGEAENIAKLMAGRQRAAKAKSRNP